jgi:hypothetical protein
MTDAAPSRGALAAAAPIVRSPIVLWAAFVLAHLWLGYLGFNAPNLPLGDVTLVYRVWVGNGMESGMWVGLDSPWVYPIVALAPMVAAWLFGSELYTGTWLSLVMIVNAGAFAVLLAVGRERRAAAAWWWIAFLVLLGPIALGRIDSITVPLALVGMLLLARVPRVATVLLTLAAWTKVWPAALVAAAVIVLRSRVAVLVTAAATTAGVVVVAILLGGGQHLLSFLTQQTGRGLQIESVIATPWIWDTALHRPGGTSIYYDTGILTFQLNGPGVDTAAALATPLVALAAAVLLLLGVRAVRLGREAVDLLPVLVLALTVALILFNKVGSPQFVTWLAVPICYGLVAARAGAGPSFRVPALLALAIAPLTQLVYPFWYDDLLAATPAAVLVLTVRNALYVALFVWSVVALVRLARRDGVSVRQEFAA